MKADNVNVLADKKDKAFVQLSFSHENVDGLISRVLQPNPRQELLLMPKGSTPGQADNKKFTRDTEIADQIEQLLGINEKMLLDYVFVQQWGIFKFIDQQPSVRARALAELFGADRAEKIYKELGEVKIEIPAAAVDADLVRKRIADNKQELAGIVNQLKQFANFPEKIEDALKKPREVVTKYDRRVKLLSDIKSMEDNKAARQERIDALMFEISPLMEQHLEMKAALDEAAPHVATAKQSLHTWQLFDQYEHQRASLSHSMSEVLVAIQHHQLKMPVQPKDLLSKEGYTTMGVITADLKFTVKRYQKILQDFVHGKAVECPTCGTSVDHMKDHLNECKEFIAGAQPEIDKSEKQMREYELYNSQLALYTSEFDKLHARAESLGEQLKKLKAVDKPSADRATFQRLIDNFDATKKKFDYLSETLRIGEGKVNVLKAEIKSIDGILEKYQAEEKTLGNLGQLDADSAARIIDQMTEKYVLRDTLRNQKRNVERLIEDDEEALDKCKVVQLRAERLVQAGSHLEDVRNVYKQLITLIPQHNMEELRVEVNANLDRFNARFRVDAIDDLRFLLRYHSGRVQPAERLSGGERVLLALAFRIAVNSRYAKELGLLCLDEPTAGLDEDNLNCLEVALGRLRELSQARGLQVIMVTHDSGLDGLFDRVIRLQAAS